MTRLLPAMKSAEASIASIAFERLFLAHIIAVKKQQVKRIITIPSTIK